MIKVIIISDIKIYCERLSGALSDFQPIKIVGAENSFKSAINTIKHEAPEVVLLDITMIGSCDFAKNISCLYPAVHIIALAVPEDENKIMECAEAGIAGYVAREATFDELVETVIGTKNGEFHCPPKITECIYNTFKRITQGNIGNNRSEEINYKCENRVALLTKRERQIYILMVEGLSNKKISSSLIIEVSTVKNHVHNILVKLDVKSRAQAVTLMQYNTYFKNTNQKISYPTIS
jgi:DNA-binding NarL/FixJ family response regulator